MHSQCACALHCTTAASQSPQPLRLPCAVARDMSAAQHTSCTRPTRSPCNLISVACSFLLFLRVVTGVADDQDTHPLSRLKLANAVDLRHHHHHHRPMSASSVEGANGSRCLGQASTIPPWTTGLASSQREPRTCARAHRSSISWPYLLRTAIWRQAAVPPRATLAPLHCHPSAADPARIFPLRPDH
jgi:hypothetical protein